MNNVILQIKKHPVITVLFIVVMALIVTELTTKKLSDIAEKTLYKDKPVISQFTLNTFKSIYMESDIAKFGQGSRVKTYVVNPEKIDSTQNTLQATYPVFNVVIDNPSEQEITITKISYNIDEVGQVRSGGVGPIESSYQYTHKLEYKKGEQEFKLAEPMTISAKSSRAFEFAMMTEHPELGLAWWTNVAFHTSNGRVATDMFQLVLSGRPNWALNVKAPQQKRLQQLKKIEEIEAQDTSKTPMPAPLTNNGGGKASQGDVRQKPMEPSVLR